MAHLEDYFRGQVLRGSTDRACTDVALYALLGESEVSDSDVTLGIDQNVFWLKAREGYGWLVVVGNTLCK